MDKLSLNNGGEMSTWLYLKVIYFLSLFYSYPFKKHLRKAVGFALQSI